MKKSLLITSFLLYFFNVYAQEINVPAFITDSLDIYVTRGLRDWKIPGCAIAVVKEGKVILTKGYGLRDIEKSDNVDENTLFLIGSNTKAFTATALALLESEKKLSLDDKVTKYLPDFKLTDPLSTGECNIRDILSHRIGLETFQGDFVNWTSNLSRKEIIHNLSVLEPKYSFRTKWGYCNAAFLAAGEIIPAVTNMQWEEFIRERFFKPLAMNRSLALSAELSSATNLCSSHTLYEGNLIRIPLPSIDNLAPAASIASSVNDMSHWVLMLLNEGKYDGNEVVPFSAIQATRFPTSIIGNGRQLYSKNVFRLYGLGWDLMDYEGRKVVSHTGGVDGFVTSVTLIPSEKLGIVILTNTDANAFYQACKMEIMDAYLNLPYRNYSAAYLKNSNKNDESEKEWLAAEREKISKNPKPSLELKAYTGKYKNDAYGAIDIVVKDGNLQVNMLRHPGMTAKLESLGEDKFLCTYSSPTFGIKEIFFTLNSGKVQSVTLKCADFVDFQPYEFKKQ